MTSPAYVIITPVRNEGDRLQQTIDSVVAQSLRPVRWVIVNDGSSDNTGQIIDAAATANPWIRKVHRQDRGFRKQGAGVVEAFYDGFALVEREAWDFVAKLDGDLSFDKDYFQKSLARFEADTHLGIGGGRVCCLVNGVSVEDAPGDPAFHVRGATKIYRRSTWDAIGGLGRVTGWDTLDEIKANMLGWRTYSFTDLKVLQLKPTGAADGSWQNFVKNGLANYITGYHPLFMLLKCLRRGYSGRSLAAPAGLGWGYVRGYLKRVPQVEPGVVRYVRREQMRRLLCKPSLWTYAGAPSSASPDNNLGRSSC